MYEKYFKRLIDFVFALLISPLVILIIIIMAPIIFINDPGPIFYNSERRGKNGNKFKMLKFRSMYINSPDLRNRDGSTFNSKNDPRVTKVGKFMRKTSIDEIPQFFNVLIGDMSMIGPRPTLASIPYDKLSAEQKKRYQVRPGITGYSQAYFRNSISNDEKIINDCYYVDNISLRFDIKIFIQTIVSVLVHKNIYVSLDEKGNKRSE